MRADSSTCVEQPLDSLGQRRGISTLERFSLDLTWARAEKESAARARDYPSPPMSGSPPLPPKPNQKSGERGQGSFQTPGRDAYRTNTAYQGEHREHLGVPSQNPLPPPPPPVMGVAQYHPAPPSRIPFSYGRPEESMRSTPYPQPPASMLHQQSYPISLPPVAGRPGSSPYGLAGRAAATENPPYNSPKTQRKTKGHVASACVPCKRAHLRCVNHSN